MSGFVCEIHKRFLFLAAAVKHLFSLSHFYYVSVSNSAASLPGSVLLQLGFWLFCQNPISSLPE